MRVRSLGLRSGIGLQAASVLFWPFFRRGPCTAGMGEWFSEYFLLGESSKPIDSLGPASAADAWARRRKELSHTRPPLSPPCDGRAAERMHRREGEREREREGAAANAIDPAFYRFRFREPLVAFPGCPIVKPLEIQVS